MEAAMECGYNNGKSRGMVAGISEGWGYSKMHAGTDQRIFGMNLRILWEMEEAQKIVYLSKNILRTDIYYNEKDMVLLIMHKRVNIEAGLWLSILLWESDSAILL